MIMKAQRQNRKYPFQFFGIWNSQESTGMHPVGDLSRKQGSGLKGRAFLNSLHRVGNRALGLVKRLKLRIVAPGKGRSRPN